MNDFELQDEPGITRRRVMTAGVAAAVGGLVSASTPAWANPAEEISHAAESIHQKPHFAASARKVFEALVDTRQFDKVIQLSAAVASKVALGNKPTQISREAGGTFVVFGGHIFGRQIEILPNERIVQAWRVRDWEPGLYSVARFQVVEKNGGTKINFDHSGFPPGEGEHLAAGWKANYWEPLAKFLAKS